MDVTIPSLGNPQRVTWCTGVIEGPPCPTLRVNDLSSTTSSTG